MEKARRNSKLDPEKDGQGSYCPPYGPNVCMCVRVCVCVRALALMHLGREGEGSCKGDCSRGDHLHCWLKDSFSLTVPGR